MRETRPTPTHGAPRLLTRRNALRLIGGMLAVGAGARLAAGKTPPRRPHILFIHADDLGWSDLGCYGADHHRTPALDRLAEEGLRFTQAYAGAPVCTPSRASLVTGRHCARLNTTGQSGYRNDDTTGRKLLHPSFETSFPVGTPTVAHTLAAAGYHPTLVGSSKWGFDDDPRLHGFREVVPGTDPELTAATLNLIGQADSTQPFFIYLNYSRPHTPLNPDPSRVREISMRPGFLESGQNAAYAAVIEEIDADVGRLLAALDRHDLTDHTLVVFGSDNGGFLGYDDTRITSNAPLREGKASLYEGGIRVPLIVRWPGMTPPKSTRTTPVHWCDWHATLAEAAGTSPVTDQPLDGVSFAPLLRSKAEKLPSRALYWHFPHYRRAMPSLAASPSSAIRQGDWKLLHFYETDHVELYHLGQDPGESRDLAAAEPGVAAALRAQLEKWRRQVNASIPPVNPAYSG